MPTLIQNDVCAEQDNIAVTAGDYTWWNQTSDSVTLTTTNNGSGWVYPQTTLKFNDFFVRLKRIKVSGVSDATLSVTPAYGTSISITEGEVTGSDYVEFTLTDSAELNLEKITFNIGLPSDFNYNTSATTASYDISPIEIELEKVPKELVPEPVGLSYDESTRTVTMQIGTYTDSISNAEFELTVLRSASFDSLTQTTVFVEDEYGDGSTIDSTGDVYVTISTNKYSSCYLALVESSQLSTFSARTYKGRIKIGTYSGIKLTDNMDGFYYNAENFTFTYSE